MGLPGHPASALVVFTVFGRAAIAWLAGESVERGITPAVQARLTRNLASGQGREEYVRVALVRDPSTGEWLAEPVLGKSGLIRTLVLGDGVVRIPAECEGYAAGQYVDVWLPGGQH
jgi:molybdopterin molybdotransferase